jgi:hypothetical protein
MQGELNDEGLRNSVRDFPGTSHGNDHPKKQGLEGAANWPRRFSLTKRLRVPRSGRKTVLVGKTMEK